MKGIIDALVEIQKDIQIIWPLHPRTKSKLKEFYLYENLSSYSNLIITKPLRYLEFQKLVSEAKFVMTDSGGIQEETTVLNVPCLTLREETERPITIKIGTNILTGLNKNKIIEVAKNIMAGPFIKNDIPKYWDGKTSKRITKIIVKWLDERSRLDVAKHE